MARPEKLRKVDRNLEIPGFKPMGTPVSELEVSTIRVDELEALRLADVVGLYQAAAAQQMGVSRQTFARILGRARTTVATAILEGRVLLIEDGPVVESGGRKIPCPVHGEGPRRGRGCRCRHGMGRGRRRPDQRNGVNE